MERVLIERLQALRKPIGKQSERKADTECQPEENEKDGKRSMGVNEVIQDEGKQSTASLITAGPPLLGMKRSLQSLVDEDWSRKRVRVRVAHFGILLSSFACNSLFSSQRSLIFLTPNESASAKPENSAADNSLHKKSNSASRQGREALANIQPSLIAKLSYDAGDVMLSNDIYKAIGKKLRLLCTPVY